MSFSVLFAAVICAKTDPSRAACARLAALSFSWDTHGEGGKESEGEAGREAERMQDDALCTSDSHRQLSRLAKCPSLIPLPLSLPLSLAASDLLLDCRIVRAAAPCSSLTFAFILLCVGLMHFSKCAWQLRLAQCQRSIIFDGAFWSSRRLLFRQLTRLPRSPFSRTLISLAPSLSLSPSLFGSLFAPLDPVNHADHALEAANYVIKLSNCSAPRRRFGRVSASSCFTASLLHFPQVANQFYASFYGCIPLSLPPSLFGIAVAVDQLRWPFIWNCLATLGHLGQAASWATRRDAMQRGIS